eukprot:15480333-Alexandrium_andersonii.AAC.1
MGIGMGDPVRRSIGALSTMTQCQGAPMGLCERRPPRLNQRACTCDGATNNGRDSEVFEGFRRIVEVSREIRRSP